MRRRVQTPPHQATFAVPSAALLIVLALACSATAVTAAESGPPYCGEKGVWLQILGAGGPEIDRITSYNVCYTKLLRIATRDAVLTYPIAI